MKQSYWLAEPSKTELALGRKLVDVLVEANVPYGAALNALDAAETILKTETKPINA